jgi:Flp pilus assembly protein TadG
MTRAIRRRKLHRSRGAALIEFALIFPVLMAIILGAIDAGVAIQARTQIINAARDGVRVAATGGNQADVQAAVSNSLKALPAGSYTMTFTCLMPDGSNCGAAIGTDATQGGKAFVTINYHYTSVTGFFPFFNFTMSQTAQMRIE